MFLLNIDAADWVKAKEYFKLNTTAVKISKKQSGCPYSFMKINDTIVAVGYKLGAGTFGVVKVAQNEKGENFAVKIEGGKLVKDDLKEEVILKLMNYSFGMIERQLDKLKTFIPNTHMEFKSKYKKYKLLELLEGTDLIFKLYDKDAYENRDCYVPINSLNEEQKLIIAIKFCNILKQLQSLRIIHADIKPENIKIKIENDNITVKIMDFGFSMILPSGVNTIVDGYKGTGPYIAPEIFNTDEPRLSTLTFSFESDIYATGVMFEANFGISHEICKGMLKKNPNERDPVDTTIKKLMTALKGLSVLSPEAMRFIAEIEPPHKPIAPLMPVAALPTPAATAPTVAAPTPALLKRVALPKVMLDQDVKVQLRATPLKPKVDINTPKGSPAPLFKLRPIAKQEQPLTHTITEEAKRELSPVARVRPATPKAVKPTVPVVAKENKAETSSPQVLEIRQRPLPQAPKRSPLNTKPTPSPKKVDFADINPSALKINRIAMLRNKLETTKAVEALKPEIEALYITTSSMTPQFDTTIAKPNFDKLTKIGVATPLLQIASKPLKM